MKRTHPICLKRAYEPIETTDGLRVLVERLWPRGLSKEKAHVDYWFKQLAPSPELRKWYGHDVERWPSFREKYRQELQQQLEAVTELQQLCRKHVVTFVYAARDEAHNSAVVLKDFLEQKA